MDFQGNKCELTKQEERLLGMESPVDLEAVDIDELNRAYQYENSVLEHRVSADDDDITASQRAEVVVLVARAPLLRSMLSRAAEVQGRTVGNGETF